MQVLFMNHGFGRMRTGIENSALLRMRIFERELGIKPVFVTFELRLDSFEVEASAREQGVLQADDRFLNMYDQLQGIDSLPLSAAPSVHPYGDSLKVELVPNTPGDERGYNRDGHMVFYGFKSRQYPGRMHFINHMDAEKNCRKWRRDWFHPNGFVRCQQWLEGKEEAVRAEMLYRADGSLAVARHFRIENGSAKLSFIELYDAQGRLAEHFSSEEALRGWWLAQHLADPCQQYCLVLDRSSIWHEPIRLARARLPAAANWKVIPVIHAVHVNDPKRIEDGPVNSFFAATLEQLPYNTATVMLTQRQADDIRRRFGEGKIRVIPHAYDPSCEPEPFEFRNRFEIVYVGRYAHEKHHELALPLFAKVLAKVPEARLHLYGQGDKCQSIEKLRDELGLAEVVQIHDFQQSVAPIFERAGLSIQTSSDEAFGLSVMESLVHGCPVAAFDVPYGPRELIQDGETGFLAGYGDIDSLAERIVALLQDEAAHRAMSQAARASSVRWSVNTVAGHWRSLLEEVGVLPRVPVASLDLPEEVEVV